MVIADFGGGTSDFSVVRVGRPGGAQVLSTSGVAIAGDAFDARLVDHVVSPALGRGSTYEAELGRTMPVPPWLQQPAPLAPPVVLAVPEDDLRRLAPHAGRPRSRTSEPSSNGLSMRMRSSQSISTAILLPLL